MALDNQASSYGCFHDVTGHGSEDDVITAAYTRGELDGVSKTTTDVLGRNFTVRLSLSQVTSSPQEQMTSSSSWRGVQLQMTSSKSSDDDDDDDVTSSEPNNRDDDWSTAMTSSTA